MIVSCLIVSSFLSPSQVHGASQQGIVVAIIDGESLVVRQSGRDSIVRLLGVAVPESHRELATAALETELLRRPVQIEHDVPALMLDTHGSRLAYVYRLPEATMMNYQLVRLGLATVPGDGEFFFRRELIAAQSAARLEKRGLWSGVSPALAWETQFRNVRYLGEVNYQTSGGRAQQSLSAAPEKKPASPARVRITNRK
ncbi:MAG TPA: thermonuclease family protein [Thermoanaerobaculia bacterium]|nr:thermonuclease family protein [Thermoanaerobaculia bacterium]